MRVQKNAPDEYFIVCNRVELRSIKEGAMLFVAAEKTWASDVRIQAAKIWIQLDEFLTQDKT